MEDTKPKTSPKDFFLHLLAIVTLYASAISFTTILFQIINISLPDLLEQRNYYLEDSYRSMLKTGLSFLIVMFPTYLGTMWFLQKGYRTAPETRKLWVRRWLVHLTLFVAALIIIGDLISLFNTFFDGELTLRFVLKILSVLFVAASVFGYYFWDIRRDDQAETKTGATIAYVTIGVVVAAVVAALVAAGSPAEARARRFDAQRVNDLSNIESQVISFWQDKDRLPADLSEMEDGLGMFMVPLDPETNEPYTYRTTGDLSFELCATFALPDDGTNRYDGPRWAHETGETCFDRTIDPDVYQIEERMIKPVPAPLID